MTVCDIPYISLLLSTSCKKPQVDNFNGSTLAPSFNRSVKRPCSLRYVSYLPQYLFEKSLTRVNKRVNKRDNKRVNTRVKKRVDTRVSV